MLYYLLKGRDNHNCENHDNDQTFIIAPPFDKEDASDDLER